MADQVLDDVAAQAALSLAIWRRFFAVQIIHGALDQMQIGRLIERAAEEASLSQPGIPASTINAHAARLQSEIDSDLGCD
jgi:hypothetical protein